MDLVSKLVPVTENLKPTAHFIFEKMDLHDGLLISSARGHRVDDGAALHWHRPVVVTRRAAVQSCADQLCCDIVAPFLPLGGHPAHFHLPSSWWLMITPPIPNFVQVNSFSRRGPSQGTTARLAIAQWIICGPGASGGLAGC